MLVFTAVPLTALKAEVPDALFEVLSSADKLINTVLEEGRLDIVWPRAARMYSAIPWPAGVLLLEVCGVLLGVIDKLPFVA